MFNKFLCCFKKKNNLIPETPGYNISKCKFQTTRYYTNTSLSPEYTSQYKKLLIN